MEKLYHKQEVAFEHPAKGPHHCSQCVHFNPDRYPEDACEIVIGAVYKGDWCKKWQQKQTRQKA